MAQNQAAWLSAAGASPLEVGDAPYDTPGAKEIVVQTEAVAINPVDWHRQMHGAMVDHYPTISGCDVAGTVDSVGQDVQIFKPGDRVIGNAACLTLGDKYGAFQRYVRCPENVTCKIPDSMSFEQSVVLPLAVNTAGLGLFGGNFLALPRPSLEPQVSETATVFIYGGSTSVGGTAIQLAKASGLTVMATAGQSNLDYCRTLGADFIFDYKDPEWITKAALALEKKELAGVFDSIATKPTVGALQQLLAHLGSKATIVTTLPSPEGTTTSMVFGANMTFDDGLSRVIWHDFLPAALANGAFVPRPDPLVAGSGLAEIQTGLDTQRKGVSARKVVVSGIQDSHTVPG